MIPRYALVIADKRPQVGWVESDPGRLWSLMLSDGSAWQGAAGRIVYGWDGEEIPDSAEDPREAALAQIAERLAPPMVLDAEALHARLPPGEGVAFEAIAAGELGGDASGWERARLYRALLGESRLFRSTRRGFVARLAVEIRQRAERDDADGERQRWLERVAEWRTQLEGGRWEPGHDAAEGEPAGRFLEQLESLAVHERQSPDWKLLSGALELHVHQWEENRVVLKGWLETAGVWGGWGRIWMAKAGVEPVFSENLAALAREMAALPLDTAGRTDYRGQDTCTFDSAQTEDYDDGCTVLAVDGEVLEVAVHVAEPSPLLAPGHPIFEEAARRASTVYSVDGIFPMLPTPLSNGRYALVAGQDRETLTYRLRISPRGGELLAVERSLVRVRVNHDYDSGEALLSSEPETWGRLARATEALAQGRIARGAHNVERHEVTIDPSDPEHIRVEPLHRREGIHRLVEELAVLTNTVAGKYFREHSLPAIYRVQPQPRHAPRPDDEWPPKIRPGAASMRGARYSLHGDVHKGLASERYAQVTSPIRRFADLLMQRQIAGHLETGRAVYADTAQLEGWLKVAEQRASTYLDLERRIANDWKRRYVAQHPGIELAGEVRRAGRTTPGDTKPARIWLKDILLEAQADLPGTIGPGTLGRYRVVKVDLDRFRVVVEPV